VIYWNTRV